MCFAHFVFSCNVGEVSSVLLKVYNLHDEYDTATCGAKSRPWISIRFISSAQEIKDMSDAVARYPCFVRCDRHRSQIPVFVRNILVQEG
jgi:hypothetical protein